MRVAPFLFIIIALGLLDACGQDPRHTEHFVKSGAGVEIALREGGAKKVRLQILAPQIIRVTAFPSESAQLQPSLMAVGHADGSVPFTVAEANDTVVVKTSDVLAEVS